MSRHVDEQTLAAFREGLLPGRKAARITAHLATCQRCAAVDAQLAAVTTILARTPAPPLPASLAARLDAALAAEIARSAEAFPSAAASPAAAAPPDGAAPPTGAHAPGERAGRRDGTPAGRDRTGRRAAPWRLAPRLAAAAAAVVILAGGGYAIARVLSPSHAGTSSSTSAGAAPSGTTITGPSSASGRAPEAAAGAPRAGVAGNLPLVVSGTHYLPGQMPAQVRAVLKRYPASVSSAGPGRAAPTVPATAFPQLHACVAHFAGGQNPRLVDIARYGTRRAAVIVVPAAGTAKLNVWVVGPGCSAHGGDVLTQFSMPASG